MPALLTSTSIDLKRDSAVSTILAAVAGSPMWPSTRAMRSEAATSADWVTFRELATTLKPRSTNALTIPAPIPCDAPVTMAVFRGPLMIVYLEYYGFRLQILPWTAVRRERMNLYPLGLLTANGHPINWLMVRGSLFRTSISHLPEARTRPMFYGRMRGSSLWLIHRSAVR